MNNEDKGVKFKEIFKQDLYNALSKMLIIIIISFILFVLFSLIFIIPYIK